MSSEPIVRLEAFEGPLDLLLHLIRRAEVEIEDIPIARIADQYMEHLRDIDRVDIDLAGEFLVTAATLMEIKSRVLAARQVGPATRGEREAAEPEDDPRADLVRQLLEYKRFRDAADALERQREQWLRRYPARRAGADDEAMRTAMRAAQDLELEELDVVDLVEAFGRIMASVNLDRIGDHTVTVDETPIERHQAEIVALLRVHAPPGSEPGLDLRELFAGRRRGEMLGVFLAVLELVRGRAVWVRQESLRGEVRVGLRPPEEAAPADAGRGDLRVNDDQRERGSGE